MELVSALNKYRMEVPQEEFEPLFYKDCIADLIRLVAPFAPHLAEELWEELGQKDSIFNEVWPQFEESALIMDTVEIVVQFNGKIAFRMDISTDETKEHLEETLMADERVKERIGEKQVRKFIYVPGRLANIVIG